MKIKHAFLFLLFGCVSSSFCSEFSKMSLDELNKKLEELLKKSSGDISENERKELFAKMKEINCEMMNKSQKIGESISK